MARFDKWRGDAISRLDDTKQHLHNFADACVADWKQSTEMTVDLVADALSGQVTFGQIMSGAVVLGLRLVHAPLRFLSPMVSVTRALREAPPP